ncbi:Protein of unknown function, partial [Gryllus bimaculatus]
PQLSDG